MLHTLTVKQIKEYLDNLTSDEKHQALKKLREDTRKTVKDLVVREERHLLKEEALLKKLSQLKLIEKNLEKKGYQSICGIDEVGRGPLAGPLVVAAVIMKKDSKIIGIDDSKKLSPHKRKDLVKRILDDVLSYTICEVSPAIIDKINILKATKKGMAQAVSHLKIQPDHLLIDAVAIDDYPEIAKSVFIKGDERCYSIAAASILAKEYRDKLMVDYHCLYPEYDFISNKGYGTRKHIQALKIHGPSPIHRKSFIKNFVIEKSDQQTKSSEIGRKAEEIAEDILKNKGHVILEKNYLEKSGEIDIISYYEGEYIFTEVKARKNTDFGHPGEFVNKTKQNKIIQAAMGYLIKKNLQHPPIRFDIVEIIGDVLNNNYTYQHYTNAFSTTTYY